ncbi:MAG: gentisate 1,2-dioxygenase [Alphaproteobacteria bacterium]
MTGQPGADAQADFHREIGTRHLAALWVARRGVDITKPKSPATPELWHYDAIRPDLMTAGEIITAEDAFRRVLVLENPAFPGEMRVTNTLYAGFQLVLPGEIAPCHRHSQTAFRFVIEGEGAYTSVDGERTWLHPGDFIITPQWSWHDHCNESDAPVVWLDVLDTPLVDFLDTVFRENYPAPRQQISRPDGDAPARFGANMLPEGYQAPAMASPVFSYPYDRARAALEQLRRAEEWDACHALMMQYVNPTTGGPATPTMGAFLQMLPAGFDGAEYRTTEGVLYSVVEGAGRTIVDGEPIEWGPRDAFVVPGWHPHRHVPDGDAILFRVSDRPVQQSLGLWREQRPGETV